MCVPIAVLEVGRVFFPGARLPTHLWPMSSDEPVSFGDLRVTAIPVDHAATDSRALLVEGDGKRLCATGRSARACRRTSSTVAVTRGHGTWSGW